MHEFKTTGVCARSVKFTLENNKIHKVNFDGGCNGNAQGLSALIEGMDVTEAITKLDGIDCKGRGTSCPDQLAKALKAVIAE